MKTEMEKLQGTWNIVSLEVEGVKMGKNAFQGSRIVVEGDAFTTISMGATYNGVFKVDTESVPKRLDLLFTEGPHTDNTSLGIYELDGDTWKICLAFAGGGRPADFVTAVGSGHALETLERAEEGRLPETLAENLPTDFATAVGSSTDSKTLDPEMARLEGEWAMVSCAQDGRPLPADWVHTGRRVVAGRETTVTFGGQVFLKATYRVDTSIKPHTIDYTITAGPNTGKTQRGIYEWEGDMVRICLSPPEKERPTLFVTEVGDARTLSVWRRSAG